MIAVMKPSFKPGKIIATPACLQALEQANHNVWTFLARHLAGDYIPFRSIFGMVLLALGTCFMLDYIKCGRKVLCFGGKRHVRQTISSSQRVPEAGPWRIPFTHRLRSPKSDNYFIIFSLDTKNII